MRYPSVAAIALHCLIIFPLNPSLFLIQISNKVYPNSFSFFFCAIRKSFRALHCASSLTLNSYVVRLLGVSTNLEFNYRVVTDLQI